MIKGDEAGRRGILRRVCDGCRAPAVSGVLAAGAPGARSAPVRAGVVRREAARREPGAHGRPSAPAQRRRPGFVAGERGRVRADARAGKGPDYGVWAARGPVGRAGARCGAVRAGACPVRSGRRRVVAGPRVLVSRGRARGLTSRGRAGGLTFRGRVRVLGSRGRARRLSGPGWSLAVPNGPQAVPGRSEQSPGARDRPGSERSRAVPPSGHGCD